MENNRVSVIVPVYNVEKYIDEALESLCNQTYSQLELILVDDGSKDNSLLKCNDWAKKDNRIKIIHQENAGVSAARNKGLELATGKYVMFMDSDDWIEKNMIEILYHQAEKYQADVACCSLQENTKRENNASAKINEDGFTGQVHLGEGQVESGLLLLKVWAPFCKLYRREIIGDCRFEEYKVAEDLFFNTKIICSARLQKVVFFEQPLYHYMIYTGSAMQQKFQEKYLVAMEVEKRCYDMLTAISPKFGDINLIGCSVSRVFEKYAQLSAAERKTHRKEFKRCKEFAWKNRKQLMNSSNRHRRISGALKVYMPDIYLWTLVIRYSKKEEQRGI